MLNFFPQKNGTYDLFEEIENDKDYKDCTIERQIEILDMSGLYNKHDKQIGYSIKSVISQKQITQKDTEKFALLFRFALDRLENELYWKKIELQKQSETELYNYERNYKKHVEQLRKSHSYEPDLFSQYKKAAKESLKKLSNEQKLKLKTDLKQLNNFYTYLKAQFNYKTGINKDQNDVYLKIWWNEFQSDYFGDEYRMNSVYKRLRSLLENMYKKNISNNSDCKNVYSRRGITDAVVWIGLNRLKDNIIYYKQ